MQPSWFTFLILFVSAPLWTLLIYWLWNVWGGEEKKFFQRYVDILFPIYLLISIIISLVTIYWADVYWEAINSPIDSQTQMNFLTNFFSFWEVRVDYGLFFVCFFVFISLYGYAKSTYNKEET